MSLSRRQLLCCSAALVAVPAAPAATRVMYIPRFGASLAINGGEPIVPFLAVDDLNLVHQIEAWTLPAYTGEPKLGATEAWDHMIDAITKFREFIKNEK